MAHPDGARFMVIVLTRQPWPDLPDFAPPHHALPILTRAARL
jgi:hypothetical protein